ncbi:S1C family serine protease [Streptomyces sp. TR06-5]|uniref:S1C family serine protease n=1 Tax=unclassified Streptomyces TaxID=2593676 RepID=UPI0039A105A7
MSTENEGAAAGTPAAGPSPAQDAAAPGAPVGSPPEPSAPPAVPNPSEEEDFPLARPERTQAPAAETSPAPAAAQGGPAAATDTEHTTRLPRIDPDDPVPGGPGPSAGGTDTATTQLPPVVPGAKDAPESAAPGALPAQRPAAPAGHPSPTGEAGPGGTGAHGDAGAPPPPPPGGYGTPYGPGSPGGPGGHGGPTGHGGPGSPGGPQSPWGAPPVPPPPPGAKRRTGGVVAAVLAAALVAGGVGGGVGYWAAQGTNGVTSSSSTTVSADGGSSSRSPESIAGIAAKALPSVVTIETSGGGEGGTGTGFVFDKEGHILTNNHVVASAASGGRLTATFSDGKSYDAEIVGRAQGYDIAVIKLVDTSGRELKPLPLGDSANMQIGDSTIAIGAPFGLSGTVTTGIISAKNRPVASSDGQGSEASYMNALQTDASINPGNSGGPLLDGKGAVIGVNSAIQSGGGGGLGGGQAGSIGLGFAIPINQAERVAKQLIETGVPVYPVIGVRVSTGQQGNGAVIAERVSDGEPVAPGGPADKAGLKPGDRIVEFDGSTIDSSPTLIASIWAHKPGETVKISYVRNGERQTTDITLGARKGDG